MIKKEGRKSQITLFIVLGMMIVIAITFYVYVNSSGIRNIDTGLSKNINLKSSIDPVKLYVESCIKQTAEQIVKEIAMHGGTTEPVNYRYYYSEKLNYLCINSQEYGCINTMLLKSSMEEEISDYVRKNLEKCVSLEPFKKAYSVEKGEINVSTIISPDYVTIGVFYPLIFSNTEMKAEVSWFESRINIPLGALYDTALGIANSEIKNGYFDQVEFMKSNTKITVEKHRPYPDIIYKLKKNGLSFNFALQGEDFASMPGLYSIKKKNGFGCCYVSDSCFKNVNQFECIKYSGVYDSSSECICSFPVLADTGSEEITTGCFVNGEWKKNSESWCEYDGVAGMGFDNVGSRHYLNYCINGIVYSEECRDFREELCTEETENINGAFMSKASCRINRWQDCSECTTSDCCKNLRLRDCLWLDNTTTKNKCVPYVPPGFRHWENSGREVCSLATEEKICSGLSCGSEWLNDASKECFMEGDCGNYWNTEGKVTYGGFFHTDIIANSGTEAYDIGQQAEAVRILDQRKSKVDLGIDNREQAQNVGKIRPAADNFARIVSSAYSILDSLSKVSAASELKGKSTVETMQIAVCEPWKAPRNAADCEKCISSPDKPCSEYKCRSLGQGCIYEEKDGIPECREMPRDEGGEFKIFIDKTKIPYGYTAKDESLVIGEKTFFGYKIEPELKPYRQFTLAVNTTKSSICREHFAPKSNFLSAGGYYFGQPVYSTQHIMQLRIPPRPEFPEKVLEIMNATTLNSFSIQLSQFKEDTASADSGIFGRLYEKLTGKTVSSAVVPVAERVFNVFMLLNAETAFYKDASEKILGKFQEGGYYLFVYCEDASGKVAEEPVFFEITISQNTEDTDAPEIISTEPLNASMFANAGERVEARLYLDEPSECRYSTIDSDFADMNASFSCVNSRYAISPYYGGTYLCSGKIPANNTDIDIFIRCIDNPRKIKQYLLQINYSPSLANSFVIFDNYLNANNLQDANTYDSSIYGNNQSLNNSMGISENGTIYVSSFFLETKPDEFSNVLFSVNSTSPALELFIDDNMDCSAAYNLSTYNSVCKKSEDFELGSYKCIFNLNFSNLSIPLIPFSVNQENDNPSDNSNDINENTNTVSENILPEGISQIKPEINIPVIITCEEKALTGTAGRNVNSKSYNLNLKRSQELEITDYGPKGEVGQGKIIMFVDTIKSSNVECSYYTELSLGMTRMDSIGNSRHAFQLKYDRLPKGYNTFYVLCSDAYGNTAEQKIEFYLLS